MSPARVPIIFVPKKDSSLRLYINYHSLNKVIIKNHYPFPLINKILDRLKRAVRFIKLNLKNKYYYIFIKYNYK